MSGGFGFGGRTVPGTGRTSIGGGSGATCWPTTGALGYWLGGASGGRGALTLGFDGGRRGARPGRAESGWPGRNASGAPADGRAVAGGMEAGTAGGGSPRSIESSLRVSRSIALTASQEDSAATSTVRSSASGEPAANS